MKNYEIGKFKASVAKLKTKLQNASVLNSENQLPTKVVEIYKLTKVKEEEQAKEST